jgi:TolA-binding protein
MTLSAISSTEDATIFNLFKEWKRTNTLNYKLRWTDVQIIKRDLLKNSTALQKEAMFKRELQSAVNAYNFGNLDLADRIFSEILNTYTFLSTKDDIYYYKAEANYFLGRYILAEKTYLKLVDEYPTSGLATTSYGRLVKLAHHFNDYEKLDKYLQSFKRVATSNDPLYNEIHFTAAVSAISNGAFEDAADYLNQINPNSEFYPDGRYLLSQAYTGAGNLDEAEQILLNLVSEYSLPPDYYFNIQLKLGYINYEKENYYQAIKYFDEISGNFTLYDRVLIGYGWAYYKAELQKEVADSMDFSYAKKYLELLINYFATSDYYLEANSLLGYIYQKEQVPEKAIRQFDYVFRSRMTKDISDKFIREQQNIRESLTDTETEKNEALFRNDLFAFTEANRKYHSLEDSLLQLKYSDISANSIAAKNEIQRMREQIRELDNLKEVAQARNNQSLVNKIESLQDKLRDTIDDYPDSGSDSDFGINYYDEYPSARKESIIEDKNNKIVSMREEALKQRLALEEELVQINQEIKSARSTKNFKHMIFLEVKADKLEDMIQEYDYLYALAHELSLSDSQINLQRWSDYGAFGIANVNYVVKQDKLQKRAYYLDQIDLINKLLNSRKNLLNHKINLVEGEINYMTRKVRRQERLRERAELDRKFEESYFDTHTSEIEEESQPVIDQERQEE